MKKFLRVLAVVVATVAALPTAKNVILRIQYHHGSETMIRLAGAPDGMTGIWEGIFDSIPCGIDIRTVLRLSLERDSTGSAFITYQQDRLGGTSSHLYSWHSLLPYDSRESGHYEFGLRYGASTITLFDRDNFFESDSTILRYRFEGDRLRIGFADEFSIDENQWGWSMSPKPPRWINLFEAW